VRLLADCHEHLKLPQQLITPASMLPEDVQKELKTKTLLDFGIAVNSAGFEFHEYYAQLPTSLVVAYALAIATSGQANKIYFAGFDGYGADDPRYKEMEHLIKSYKNQTNAIEIISITPTRYELKTQSIYGLLT